MTQQTGVPSIYERLKSALADSVAAAVATIVRGEQVGAKMLILPDEMVGTLGDSSLDREVSEDAGRLLAEEQSATRSYDRGEASVDVFIEVFPPPPTLLIFGAVHVAQALSRFAKMLGFEVIVSDARAKLATVERFPDADRIIQAWPDEALEELSLGRNTYVAILTHDPKFDEPALLGTLGTQARYIGAVGSRKTSAGRRERLLEAGVQVEDIDRIHGPIGLDIGASTPEEMAISILGEIIAVRNGRAGGSLTHASGKIRARV